MHVEKTIVRTDRKNGGTAVVFRLSRHAVVRFTIVRVYPSCERVGSFSVRGQPGPNRIRFRGRFRGKPLAEGTYRLLVHTAGNPAAAAAVTIVVRHGKASAAEVRRARNANSCSPAEAHEIAIAASGHDDGSGSGSQGVASEKKRPGVVDRVGGAVKGVGETAREVTRKIGGAVDAADNPLSDPFVVGLVGLLALTSALLGGFVLQRLARGQPLR